MTHIDPYAPGDSPQHPANFGTSQEAEPVQESPEMAHYNELLQQYGTAEEQQAATAEHASGDLLPELEQLEQRAEDHGQYRLRLSLFGSEEERGRDDWTHWQLAERFAYPDVPGSGALKADWVAYAERIAQVRGEDIPRNEQGEPGTIAQLQEYTAEVYNAEQVAALERADQQLNQDEE